MRQPVNVTALRALIASLDYTSLLSILTRTKTSTNTFPTLIGRSDHARGELTEAPPSVLWFSRKRAVKDDACVADDVHDHP
ncbi:hypothetical protein I6F35_07125 [Bradyrhizobium sp. BRP22]|uniref:hypothetical protein n=1 Tax=Bradyrhizobium sp. BRP22 TaxID=2793821 RepID=UPI001CD4808B|nr:hypothetical protein [Bradyrhizobium sp. BRP22]MCA1452991.1 hypothetical protein [Bradyrhizobium sp. BRP22]